MRITELAQLTGVTPRRLRYFEARGLLSPARDNHGWRDYDQHDRQRVEQINQLVSAGIPTDLALRMLDARASGAGEPPDRAHRRDDGVDPRSNYAKVLTDILAFYQQLDARVRCVTRNRDALAAWLDEQGVHDLGS